MSGLVFTADRAGEVQADMSTLREYSKTGKDRPPTPVGWSDTDWLKHLEEIRQDQETYHRGPLPETGWD